MEQSKQRPWLNTSDFCLKLVKQTIIATVRTGFSKHALGEGRERGREKREDRRMYMYEHALEIFLLIIALNELCTLNSCPGRFTQALNDIQLK